MSDLLMAENIALKIIFSIMFGLFFVFSVIVVRQIQLMLVSVSGPLNWLVRLMGWLVFGLALFFLVVAIVWL